MLSKCFCWSWIFKPDFFFPLRGSCSYNPVFHIPRCWKCTELLKLIMRVYNKRSSDALSQMVCRKKPMHRSWVSVLSDMWHPSTYMPHRKVWELFLVLCKMLLFKLHSPSPKWWPTHHDVINNSSFFSLLLLFYSLNMPEMPLSCDSKWDFVFVH